MRGLLKTLRQKRGDWGLGVYSLLLVSSLAYVLMPFLLVKMLDVSSEHRLLVALFVTAVFIYAVCQNRIAMLISERLERGVGRLLMRVANDLTRLNLASVERLGITRVRNLITHEVAVLSGVGDVLGPILQKVCVMGLICLAMVLLSPAAAFIWNALIIGCLLHSWAQSERLRSTSAQSARFDNAQREYSEGFMEGLRQIHGSRLLRRGLRATLTRHLKLAGRREAEVGGRMLRMWQGYHGVYFLGLACFLFLLPLYSVVPESEILAMVILLTLTPINDVAQGLPQVFRANVSAKRLADFETRLRRVPVEADEKTTPVGRLGWIKGAEVELKNVMFGYRESSDRFELGPVSMTLKHGETLLIVGRNGSGKSTLLRVLMGLYPARKGGLQIGGRPIGNATLSAYRGLFSYVPADPFLFDRLFGMENVDDDKANEWLDRCRVPRESVNVQDGAFSSVDLALDIRKRVALVVALLEDRPILVLDEIGGNQDEPYREMIYGSLLPELKAQGKTIIYASHDDHFFDRADRMLRIEKGRLV